MEIEMEEINYELSGGSFNVKRRKLATFTMATVDGRIVVRDDRPSFASMHYHDTKFDTVEGAVKYWGMIDERRMIMG